MKTTHIQPYLFFGGRCDEALAFYKEAVGAKVEFLMRYAESPQPMPPGSIPAGFEQKVMHGTIRVGETALMVSDGMDTEMKFAGFSLSITLPEAAEARKVFAALSLGGQVSMPLDKTFWSPCFGMLTDRFGVAWMVTVAA